MTVEQRMPEQDPGRFRQQLIRGRPALRQRAIPKRLANRRRRLPRRHRPIRQRGEKLGDVVNERMAKSTELRRTHLQRCVPRPTIPASLSLCHRFSCFSPLQMLSWQVILSATWVRYTSTTPTPAVDSFLPFLTLRISVLSSSPRTATPFSILSSARAV